MKGAMKASASFNGNGPDEKCRGNYNISKVSRSDTGDYKVNFKRKILNHRHYNLPTFTLRDHLKDCFGWLCCGVRT